jgi:coenzyme F420-0:L-glutamate ligase/coenzyme F420-1:gamma-L-glutamate ligase
MTRYEVLGVADLPEIRPGDDLCGLIMEAARRQGTPLLSGDLLVIGQKIVSKAEGRLVRLGDVQPSPAAVSMAAQLGRDARLVEVILRESRRIVRMDRGVLITETHHGWVCANAGVDQSNVERDCVALLPEDSDRSARRLREQIRERAGVEVGLIIADTFGRPWREGLTNVAIGVSGLAPLRSYLGMKDEAGRELQATILAVADELAGVPVAIVRGLPLTSSDEGSKPLLRDPARDLFR